LCEPTITREICLITRQLRSFSANTRRILDVLMATVRETEHLNGAKLVAASHPANEVLAG
jgi:hypothetical protein